MTFYFITAVVNSFDESKYLIVNWLKGKINSAELYHNPYLRCKMIDYSEFLSEKSTERFIKIYLNTFVLYEHNSDMRKNVLEERSILTMKT